MQHHSFVKNLLPLSMSISRALSVNQYFFIFRYAEIKDYDFNDPQFSPKTGHFTQVSTLLSSGDWNGVVFKLFHLRCIFL